MIFFPKFRPQLFEVLGALGAVGWLREHPGSLWERPGGLWERQEASGEKSFLFFLFFTFFEIFHF